MTFLLLACAEPPPEKTPQAVAASLSLPTTHLAVEVGQPLTLEAGAAGGTVTWAFGDGGAAEGTTVEHAWENAGNYLAIATLPAPDGRRLSETVRIEVFRSPAPTPPRRSGSLWVEDDGTAWVVTPEADTLARIVEGASTYLPTCDEPRAVARVADEVAVTCGDGQLWSWSATDLSSRIMVDFGVGSSPFGVIGDEGGWWVSLGGNGSLTHLSFDGLGSSSTSLGPEPRGLVLGPDGTVWASRYRNDAAGAVIYRSDGGSISLPVHPGPDSDTLSGGLPNLIETFALSPDGGTLYIPVIQANIRRGLLGSGVPLTFETTTRAALLSVPVDADEEDWNDRKIFDNQDRAVAVAPSPTGNYLAVAHPGTGVVQLLDAFTLDLAGSLPGAGEGLRDLRWVGDTLITWAWLDRTVAAWRVGEPGELPTLLWSAASVAEEPLTPTVLLGKKLFYRSGDVRISKDGYLACASCHPDGEHDGLTWDFTSRGEGLRNTTSLLGRGGTDMGYLHWSANFDEVQDFENDIRNQFGGTGLLTDADWAETSDTLGSAKAGRSADLDALAAYVTSLAQTPVSPHPASPSGEAAFLAAGCADCHPAPAYTDSDLSELRLHDVGTLTDASGGRLGGELTGIDTPTLLGVFSTGPWLHDGSALTVEDAIRAHRTLTLTEVELDEITAFVLGL